MPTEARIAIEHESDIVTARQRGRSLAAAIGMSSTDQTLVALAISEIARNILAYAEKGELTIDTIEEGGRHAVSIVARDEGPGIADIELAMQDGYSTARSLGAGLPGAKRIMDEFHIETALGQGTTVSMKKWTA